MSKSKSVLLALLTIVASGTMVSSAFALPDISVTLLPLACYEVSEFKAEERAGNWNTNTCKGEEQKKLTSKWVLAEPIFQLPGQPTLWCAKLTPYVLNTNSETGSFSNNLCTTKAKDGEYVDVEVPNAWPLHLNYLSNTVKTELQNTSGGIFHGAGLHVLYLFGELTALGTFRAIFLKVEKGTELCFNQGVEANGEVSTEGSFHIVYTSLASSTQGLQLGVLYLPKELTGTAGANQEISCPTSALKIKVRGSLIGTLNLSGTTEATQLTGLKGVLNGVNGKQEFRAFWNDAGTGLLAKLESNISGAGFKESNEIVEGAPELTALEGKMFVLTSR
jgi:hypothetical protein